MLAAGCRGQTDPATDVTWDSATLNASGTANNGPAFSYFEYWPTADSSNRVQTSTRHWKAGTSGPFRELVAGLKQNTEYSFRVCGQDEGQAAVCAQTLKFKTKVGNTVRGNWGFRGFCCAHTIPPVPSRDNGVDASSGPNGERPTGTLVADASDGSDGHPSSGQTYTVTCLKIDRTPKGYIRAAIGYGGHVVWLWYRPYSAVRAFSDPVDGNCNTATPPAENAGHDNTDGQILAPYAHFTINGTP
jgi:hypothetical protein